MTHYLITDPSFYTHDIKTFEAKLHSVFTQHRPDMALYRDKESRHYANFAQTFVRVCKEHKVKSILHNDLLLATRLEAFGVHFSANRLCSIGRQSPDLYTIFSAHNELEIQNAINLGVDAVTFSPVFSTPNKGEPVGLEVLKEVVDTFGTKIDIIALGGIVTLEQIEAVEAVRAKGFASIRYFTK